MLQQKPGKKPKINGSKVIYSSESNDQKIKLIVVQSSFIDVIQAMYRNEEMSQELILDNQASKNEEHTTEPSKPNLIVYQATNPDSSEQSAEQLVADSVLVNEVGALAESSRAHEDTQHIHNNMKSKGQDKQLSEKVSEGEQDNEKPLKDAEKQVNEHQTTKQETKTFNENQTTKLDTTKQQNLIKEDSIIAEPSGKEIKMMDTITFVNGFQPVHWIYTDLFGRIQSKEISQISVNEVIKAFLINLNHNKKADFDNDDLMQFMDRDQIDQKICFAIKGQRRELLDINDLLALHEKFPRGIDALQLFKIPTRKFIPFYFHHILAFDQMGRPVRSTLIRLPISEVQQQLDKNSLKQNMELLKQNTQKIQGRIQQVSNDVVARLTEVSPVVLLNIVIVYLLEDDSLEPWFIGTQKCEVLTQKVTSKRKGKRQFLKVATPTTKQIQDYKSNTNNTKSWEEIPSSPDSPTKIQLIEANIQSNEYGPYVSQNRINNRAGRTSSTTTVFQKLDSRSHRTTQKNYQYEEDDQYMVLLNGGDENVDVIQLNQEKFAKDGSVSLSRLSEQVKIDDFSAIASAARLKSSFDEGNKFRRQAASGLVRTQPRSQSGQIRTDQGSVYTNQVNSGTGTHSYHNVEGTRVREFVEQDGNDVADSNDHNNQTQPPDGHATNQSDSSSNQKQDDVKNVAETVKQEDGDVEDILQNQTFIENLREGDLYNENYDEMMLPVAKQYRGHSANVYNPRYKLHHQSSGVHSHLGKLGLPQNYTNKRLTKKDVYLLASNELLSQDELFQGLAKIGMEYGRSTSVKNDLKFLNRVQKRSRSKFGKNGRGLLSDGGKIGSTASRIREFLDRQEQLKAMSNETKAQRMIVKPQDRRLLNLFPQFLDKSASRHHSKFLFGDSEQHHVFRDYKNAIKSVENQVKNLGESMLPQQVLKDDVKMFNLARETAGGGKVFDLKMSETAQEMLFLDHVIGSRNKLSTSQLNLNRNDERQKSLIDNKNTNLAFFTEWNSAKQKKENSIDGSNSDTSNINMEARNIKRQAPTQKQKTGQKDFLAEALKESRKVFMKQVTKTSLLNDWDLQALSMIQVQKQLEGIAVCDAEKVIHDFKNNKLYQPMLAEDDYKIVGQVPKVNEELAQKYVEMRDAMRRRKDLEQAQARVNNKYSSASQQSFYSKNMATTKISNKNSSGRKTLQSAKVGKNINLIKVNDVQEFDKQNRNQLQFNNQRSGNPINIISNIKAESSLVTTNTWQNAPQTQLAQDNSSLDHIALPHRKNGPGPEMNVQPTRYLSDDRSNQNIEKIQTLETLHEKNKCSLAIFCSNTKIVPSQEMSLDDICYIQKGELTRAKNFFKQNQIEDSIMHYSKQFNEFAGSLNKHEEFNYIVNPSNAFEGMSQTEIEFSRKEVGVGRSVQDIDFSNTQIHLGVSSQTSNQTISVAAYDLREEAIGSDKQISMQNTFDRPLQLSGLIGTRNDQEMTRYQMITQKIIQETSQSIVPMHIGKSQDGRSGSFEFSEILGLKGITAVKKLTDIVLRDLSGGILSEEYSPGVKKSVPDGIKTPVLGGDSQGSNEGSVILKPIKEYAKQKQIFHHEQGAPKLKIQKTRTTSMTFGASHLQINNLREYDSIHDRAPEANEYQLGSQLQQLGIRHLKVDQESWVPSPEFVPCCVRCFSIATYVLNYQIDKQGQGKQTRS